MSDEELYDLYVEYIWTKAPEVYRDELDGCEKAILAGIRTIIGIAFAQSLAGAKPFVDAFYGRVSTEGAAWAAEEAVDEHLHS